MSPVPQKELIELLQRSAKATLVRHHGQENYFPAISTGLSDLSRLVSDEKVLDVLSKMIKT